jgi:hypothetical protein
MATIPIEQTIGDTYRFVFKNILSIFGIAWLPMVLVAAVFGAGFWILWPDVAGLDWSGHSEAVQNSAIAERLAIKVVSLALPLEILFGLLMVMLSVGLQRKALGLIEGPVFMFFSLGGAVWRLFFGYILAFILIWLSTALSVGAVVLIFSFGQRMPALYGLVEFAAIVAAICWFFYLTVRLMFFIPTVVVAEGGLGLERSWALGHGNFWRIVVVFLACVFAPSIVVSTAANMIIWPFMMGPMMQIQQATEAHQVLPPDQALALFSGVFRQILPLWVGIELVTLPIMVGLSNAMSAFAYRHLTSPKAAA